MEKTIKLSHYILEVMDTHKDTLKPINNTLKPLKKVWYRERYGAYAYIYFKHTQIQRIKYSIYHKTYREMHGISKECIGKSKKYIL